MSERQVIVPVVGSTRGRIGGGRVALPLLAVLLLAGCSRGGGDDGPPPPPDDPPALQSVSPATAEPGQTVTILGTDFEPFGVESFVFFGESRAVVTESAPDRIVCTVPPGAAAGAVVLSVSTRTGTTDPQTVTSTFTVLDPGGAATVSEIATDAGDPTVVSFVGQVIRVRGSGFSAVASENTVFLGGIAAPVLSSTTAEVRVSVPDAARSGPVAVQRQGVGPSTDGPLLLILSSVPHPIEAGTTATAGGALLRAVPFARLVVDVTVQRDGQDTFPPTGTALLNLKTALEERLQKPGGVTVLSPGLFDSTKDSWTEDEVRAFAPTVRRFFSRDDTIVVHVTFLGGVASPNDEVIGLAFDATETAVFEEKLQSGIISGGVLSHVETAVMVHEHGHLLGLVDLGLTMQVDHEDATSTGHDASAACVMHKSIRTTGIGALQQPIDFDAQCIADIQAAGGK